MGKDKCENCDQDCEASCDEKCECVDEVIHFEQADLQMTCSCGNKEIVATNLRGGIMLPTTNQAAIQMVCKGCGVTVKVQFIDAANPVDLTEKEEEKDEHLLDEEVHEKSE